MSGARITLSDAVCLRQVPRRQQQQHPQPSSQTVPKKARRNSAAKISVPQPEEASADSAPQLVLSALSAAEESVLLLVQGEGIHLYGDGMSARPVLPVSLHHSVAFTVPPVCVGRAVFGAPCADAEIPGSAPVACGVVYRWAEETDGKTGIRIVKCHKFPQPAPVVAMHAVDNARLLVLSAQAVSIHGADMKTLHSLDLPQLADYAGSVCAGSSLAVLTSSPVAAGVDLLLVDVRANGTLRSHPSLRVAGVRGAGAFTWDGANLCIFDRESFSVRIFSRSARSKDALVYRGAIALDALYNSGDIALVAAGPEYIAVLGQSYLGAQNDCLSVWDLAYRTMQCKLELDNYSSGEEARSEKTKIYGSATERRRYQLATDNVHNHGGGATASLPPRTIVMQRGNAVEYVSCHLPAMTLLAAMRGRKQQQQQLQQQQQPGAADGPAGKHTKEQQTFVDIDNFRDDEPKIVQFLRGDTRYLLETLPKRKPELFPKYALRVLETLPLPPAGGGETELAHAILEGLLANAQSRTAQQLSAAFRQLAASSVAHTAFVLRALEGRLFGADSQLQAGGRQRVERRVLEFTLAFLDGAAATLASSSSSAAEHEESVLRLSELVDTELRLCRDFRSTLAVVRAALLQMDCGDSGGRSAATAGVHGENADSLGGWRERGVYKRIREGERLRRRQNALKTRTNAQYWIQVIEI